MNKAEADAVKAEFNQSPDYSSCLEIMSQEEIDSCLENLDLFESLFELEINDYSLDDTHDLLDEEVGILTRAFWFSKGMEDNFVCIRGDGLFNVAGEGCPYDLLAQVSTLMETLLEGGE